MLDISIWTKYLNLTEKKELSIPADELPENLQGKGFHFTISFRLQKSKITVRDDCIFSIRMCRFLSTSDKIEVLSLAFKIFAQIE